MRQHRQSVKSSRQSQPSFARPGKADPFQIEIDSKQLANEELRKGRMLSSDSIVSWGAPRKSLANRLRSHLFPKARDSYVDIRAAQ